MNYEDLKRYEDDYLIKAKTIFLSFIRREKGRSCISSEDLVKIKKELPKTRIVAFGYEFENYKCFLDKQILFLYKGEKTRGFYNITNH